MAHGFSMKSSWFDLAAENVEMEVAFMQGYWIFLKLSYSLFVTTAQVDDKRVKGARSI